MSTNVNYVGAASLFDARLSARRKADAMDSQADDESTRSAKRCKRSEEVVEKIHPCFERSSLKGSSKKRLRSEGKAVKLRKPSKGSLRNIPTQSTSCEGVHFAVTFAPKPFAHRLDAMEEIEVYSSATGLHLVSQTKQPAVPSQHHLVPTSIDGSQTVEAVGLIEASASISTSDMKTEIAPEHVLALDAAEISFGDKDMVMADAPQVTVPAGPKSFISRFLARAVAAPYTRTWRPRGLTPAPRARGSLMVPVLKPAPSNEDIVASTVEDVVLDIPMETREGSPAPIDVIDCLTLEEPPTDIVFIAEVHELPCPLSPVPVAVESDEDVFGPVSLVSQSEAEVMEIEVFYDAFEEVEDEDMHEGDAFFSLPPSPSPSSPQLFSATLDHHCDDDSCISCLLRTDLPQAPISPPSLCNTGSENSSAYTTDIDEYCIKSAPYNVAANPAIWLLRDSPILDLDDNDDDDDDVVVKSAEEMLEGDILPTAANPRFVELVSRLDKWSCQDSGRVLPTASYADVLMSSDSEVWYDAMDDSVSPAASLVDIQMAYDVSYTDFMDGILVDHVHYSAPPSSAISATGVSAELDYALPGHPHTTIGDYGMMALLSSPFEPRWVSSFPTARRDAADTPLMGTDACLGSSMDLDIADGYCVLVPGLGYIATPAHPSCSSRLSEDDPTLAMLVDVPSMDLMDISVSWMPTPVPSPVFPGAWREDFESMDDIPP